MIFSNINYKGNHLDLSKDIVKCLEYAKENSLSDYETGKHEIDGDNIYLNIVEYETFEREERIWEAHRKYIDIHLMLSGSEIIDLNFIDNLEQKEEYKEADDFIELHGNRNSYVELKAGDFLVCYPEDAHRPAIKVNKKESIRKAVFKVRIR